jgi:large subunit ribosomal protein L31
MHKIWQNSGSSLPSPTQIYLVRQNPCNIKNQRVMKKDLHPKSYRLVVFKDMSNEYSFLSRSTAASKETVKWEDGKEYPLVKLEISNTSHPFFTGKNMLVDTAGRIDKFKKKYAKKTE